MRLSILCFLFLLACTSKNGLLSEKEFARIYQAALMKQHPDAQFELNDDLSITAKKGKLEFRHYTDNAYIAYKATPDSLQAIIGRYLASSDEQYGDERPINPANIVSIIKPVSYLQQITAGQVPPMVTEPYNAQLIIAYGEDSENSIRYLTEANLQALAISRDSLRALAVRNLDRIVPNIESQEDHGVYLISAGGNYEASLILLPAIWSKENFPVDGDFIVAIPNRDLLLVTGSNNKAGMAKVKEIVAQVYKTENYLISEHLYRWTGKRFEQYE